MNRPRIVSLMLCSALAASSAPAGAQMYRWVDEDGRTVVSDSPPPPKYKAQQIRKATPSAPNDADAPVEGKDKTANDKVKPTAKTATPDAATCALARQNLQALESGQELVMTNARGERTPMDAAARAAELAKMRAILKDCRN